MPVSFAATMFQISGLARQVAQVIILLSALALTAASIAMAFGVLDWPEIAATYAGQPLPYAGMWAQLAANALLLALVFFLPANLRMARLEKSHRSFAMGVEDVSRAYRVAHAADRTGVFALSGEFESMRARFDHLRQHPDLGHLEPELMNLAAEMSFLSRDLARTYSDDKVARAKSFLKQRQEEVHMITDRIAAARRTCDELRRWLADIQADDRKAQHQIRRLEADLQEILPTLGYDFDLDGVASGSQSSATQIPGNVVPLNKPGK